MPDLLTIHAPQQPEISVALNGQPMVIGSDPGCNVVVNDPSVLPHHAYVAPDGGAWRVTAYDENLALRFEDQVVPELRLEKSLRFAIGQTRIDFTRETVVPEKRTVTPAPATTATENPEAAVAQLNAAMQRIRTEMARVVIGQSEVVNQILVALFARGHCLLVGTPGLAKTLMARTLADALELECKRVQFTPDLMPADITGTQVLEQDAATNTRNFRFKPGPIFTNLLLADEINRTPPKTQAALLEAMQERRVTISGQSYDLPAPFFVIATQNPIEQEGTYPLPEAQLDRFLLDIRIEYPHAADERAMLLATTGVRQARAVAVLSAADVIDAQMLVRAMPVGSKVVDGIMALVRGARPESPAWGALAGQLAWGPGPRAAQALMLGARARALLDGRLAPSLDDVAALAAPALRHRMALNFAAQSEGVKLDDIIARLVAGL
jgi:MoxR-like ATPase